MDATKFVYIASSIKFKDEIEALAHLLDQTWSFKTTRHWWDRYIKDDKRVQQLSNKEFYSDPELQLIWEFDKQAIKDSEIVIVYTKNGHQLTGALVELGIAKCLGKTVIICGEIKRSAVFCDCIHVKDEKELLEILRRQLGEE